MAMELDAAEKKILRETVFPPEFSKKVDTKKVNLEVLKQYVFKLATTSTAVRY
jgi:serine/arginine repetitive matrix protein 1